jgi:hypothetical protein
MNIIQPLGVYTRYIREYGTNITTFHHRIIRLSLQTATVVAK